MSENAFVAAMSNVAYTANGAISNAVVDPTDRVEGLMGLFYKSVRGVDSETICQRLKKAMQEDPIKAIQIVFHIRDCRGGKGERHIGNTCFSRLMDWEELYNDGLFAKVIDKIPEYGRWDDLVLLTGSRRQCDRIFTIISDQLKSDIGALLAKQPTSLLAKWMPTEGHKLDRETQFVDRFCEFQKITKRAYRKRISSLRAHIDIVERKLCANEWSVIDYSKVPSCAMHKLKKAFKEHDSERFNKWVGSLSDATKNTKVNAKQLFPYEITREYIGNSDWVRSSKVDPLREAQWKELVKNTAILKNSLIVCDVSGSMYSGLNSIRPIDVAISLTLLISESMPEPFHNKAITFSENPKFHEIRGETLLDRIKSLKRADWGMSTNLQAVFNLILDTARRCKLKSEDMPKRIIIISDMQFNSAYPNRATNYDVIKDKYRTHDYTMPQIVFWNVSGSYKDYPVQTTDAGTVLISGFNTAIIKYLLDGVDITPIDIVNNVINSERYSELATIMRM